MDIFKRAETIKKEYLNYLRSSFKFDSKLLQDKFKAKLEEKDLFTKGLYVEFKEAYTTGPTIKELVDEKILSPLFLNSKYRNFQSNSHLYAHQVKAVKIANSNKNMVVSTGTSSGKTMCYLIPILNKLLKEKEELEKIGKNELSPGIRAILIYPMNALAKDQTETLDEILKDYDFITVGNYTGDTPPEVDKNAKRACKGKLLSREEMIATPPHILITNYSMLERIMLRPGDYGIFKNANVKYIVLDEAHTYYGVSGIETSYTLRKLVYNLKQKERPNFILTSATLGDENDFDKITDFAERLTSSKFSTDCVVLGSKKDLPISPKLFNLSIEDIINLYDYKNNIGNLKQFILEKTNWKDKLDIDLTSQSTDDIICSILLKTSFFAKFYTDIRKNNYLLDFSSALVRYNILPNELTKFINLISSVKFDNRPLLDAKYHLFIKSLEGAYMPIKSQNEFYFLPTKYTEDKERVYEIVHCKSCGSYAFRGTIVEDPDTETVYFEHTQNDDADVYIAYIKNNKSLISTETLDDNDILNDTEVETTEDFDIEDQEENIQNKSSKNSEFLSYRKLCPKCGRLFLDDKVCDDCKVETLNINLVKSKKKVRCQFCGLGTLNKIRLGTDGSTSAIATSIYESLDSKPITVNVQNVGFLQTTTQIKEDKKFLVFSDSRQKASTFALEFELYYNNFMRKRSLLKLLEFEYNHNKKTEFTYNELIEKLINWFKEKQMFKTFDQSDGVSTLSEYLKKQAHLVLLDEIYSKNNNHSLFKLGKLQFNYHDNLLYKKLVDSLLNNSEFDFKSRSQLENIIDFIIDTMLDKHCIDFSVCSDLLTTEDKNRILRTSISSRHLSKFVSNVVKDKNPGAFFCYILIPLLKGGDSNEEKFKYYKRTSLFSKLKNVLGSEERAEKLLIGIFDTFYECAINNNINFSLGGISSTNKTLKNLGLENIQLLLKELSFYTDKSKLVKWFRCKKCHKLHAYNIDNLCTRNNCDGELEEINPGILSDDDAYAKLYDKDNFEDLNVQEHTAQIEQNKASEYQDAFKNGLINCLSCSTTFEMGVDIGTLETVFLRNIPPTPSNYIQRAGRAGRGKDTSAFIVTFATFGEHDATFYRTPQNMIAGKITPPVFITKNTKVAKRHFASIAFSLFFKKFPEYYGSREGDICKFILKSNGFEKFKERVLSNPPELTDYLNFVIMNDKEFAKEVGLIDNSRTKILFNDDEHHEGILENNVNELRDTYNMKLENNADSSKHRQNIEKTKVIQFLTEINLLPKFNFPIDVVTLSQFNKYTSNQNVDLNRDIQIAISEYAPNSVVIADKSAFIPRYINPKFYVKGTNEPYFDISKIAKCKSCNSYNYVSPYEDLSEDMKCTDCGAPLQKDDFVESINPIRGFTSQKEQYDSSKLVKKEKSYKTDDLYIGSDKAYPKKKKLLLFDNEEVLIETLSNDELLIVSTDKFYVCRECGYAISTKQQIKNNKEISKKMKEEEREITDEDLIHKSLRTRQDCPSKTLVKTSLYHTFLTDVARITFKNVSPKLFNKSDEKLLYSKYYSLMYAILRAISQYYSIALDDIKATLKRINHDDKIDMMIVIYDAVPGGAGHSLRLSIDDENDINNFKAILNLAKENMSNCGCDEETSCYQCLKMYRNQRQHHILIRKYAKELLEKLCKAKVTAKDIEE